MLSRREFVDLVALLVALPACKEHRQEPAPTNPVPAPAPGALDSATYRTLDAVTARILPGDDKIPSARAAGVIEFLDRQLTIAPLTKLAPVFIALAQALDTAARTRGKGSFSMLALAAQDELVDAMSRGRLGTQLPERELFRLLHGFTLE